MMQEVTSVCSRGEQSADDARGNQACAQEESDLQTMQEVTSVCSRGERSVDDARGNQRVLKRRAICR